MQRISALVFGAIIGAAAMWVSMSYHILRTRDGVTWVPKYRAQISDTFMDVRDWGLTEWTEHPDLVMTLEQNGQRDVVGDTKLGQTLKDAVNLVK